MSSLHRPVDSILPDFGILAWLSAKGVLKEDLKGFHWFLNWSAIFPGMYS
jgi:hypothetical protein